MNDFTNEYIKAIIAKVICTDCSTEVVEKECRAFNNTCEDAVLSYEKERDGFYLKILDHFGNLQQLKLREAK